MVRGISRVLTLWGAVSALGAVALWMFVRERYRRGGPMPASQAAMLLDPRRPMLQPVAETLRSLGLREGGTVLELGPGPGYFSVEASRIAGPGGRVLCLDLQPEMTRILRRRLDEAGARNAHPVAADATRLPLADGSVDRAFLVTVLGEIADRPAALRELRRVLRPGGELAIMETVTDPDYQLEASVRDLCAACGFAVRDVRHRRLGYTAVFQVVDG
ncbi:MAG TPA: methyltransferase domain-containing protein [Dehalococcoidia bacterium]|nr:methyltransferase domain-containing protein [Dehalococcoidia bacterium]